MIRKNQTLLNALNVVMDGLLLIPAVCLAWLVRFDWLRGVITVPLRSYFLSLVPIIPVQLLIFAALKLYDSQRKNRLHVQLLRMLGGTLICLVLILSALYLFKSFHFSRMTWFLFCVFENLLLGGKRITLMWLLHLLRRSGYNQKHILVVGDNLMARRFVEELKSNPQLGYQLIGYISAQESWAGEKRLGCFEDAEVLIEALMPDEVFASLTGEEYIYLERIIESCNLNGIRFSLIPFYSQFMDADTQTDSLNGIPILSIRKLPLDYLWNAFLKRSMDLLGSLLLLLLLSPLMLLVTLGVKLSSPGPILFRQERVGYGSVPFTMLKFRSMTVNESSSTAWTKANDPRCTAFGAFIRKYSLDELPQLINVLRGEMSLVGPRPELPYFVKQFRNSIPVYLTRQQVRPGMTGWAQIHGLRGDTSVEQRVRYDGWYIRNWNLLLDCEILLRTLFGGFINHEE